jgi:inner membrane protease subunit 1
MISHFYAHPVRLTLAVLKLLCGAHLFVSHVFQVSAAAGPSMLPTFAVDGVWIANDMTHARDRRRRLRVGDLVLYRIPIADGADGVKRVVGMPGDYVSMGTPGEPGDDTMIQVPQGHCWLVGDNLAASRDSRHFGPLPIALIKGKVVAKVLPWAESEWIRNGLQPSQGP